jgi:hypothetical protein
MEISVPEPDWPSQHEAQEAHDEFMEEVERELDEGMVGDRQLTR